MQKIQGYSSGHGKGFVRFFLRVPQAVGLYCSCNAAQAGKRNCQKTLKQNISLDLMNNPILIVTRSDNFSFGIVITFISHTSPIITVFRRSLCGLITHHVGSSYAITAAMNEHEAIRSPSVALLSTLSVLVTHSITRRFK